VDEGSFDVSGIMEAVREQLAKQGIDFESCCPTDEFADGEGVCCRPQVKVVCVPPNVKASVEEMSQSARDQVVMVRVDHETAALLDAWVETSAVKSRSEAAALFIREGLKVRASELDRLNDALRGVRDAKDRLRREAREAFGMGEDERGK
jgi:hypothetical protein